jgi:hypothetical protein
LGGSSHSFLKITNFPSSGSFQELAWFLEFFFSYFRELPRIHCFHYIFTTSSLFKCIFKKLFKFFF